MDYLSKYVATYPWKCLKWDQMAIWLLGVKQQMADGLDPTPECLSVTWELVKNRFQSPVPVLIN